LEERPCLIRRHQARVTYNVCRQNCRKLSFWARHGPLPDYGDAMVMPQQVSIVKRIPASPVGERGWRSAESTLCCGCPGTDDPWIVEFEVGNDAVASLLRVKLRRSCQVRDTAAYAPSADIVNHATGPGPMLSARATSARSTLAE